MTRIPTRLPAEVSPPGFFLQEELDARGWSRSDLHGALGNNPKECCAVDLVLDVHSKDIILDMETSAAIARAFGVDPDFFFNLDRAWRGV